MTPTQRTEPTANEPHLGWEQALSVAIGDYGSLGGRPWEQVSRIEIFPGVTVGDKIWIIPETWLPPGAMRRLSSRTLFASCLADTSDTIDTVVLDQSLRRSLLGLALPRRTQTGVRRLKVSSWLGRARVLLHMSHWVAQHRPSPTGQLWSHLVANDWDAMVAAISSSHRSQTTIRIIARDLAELGSRCVLSDFPVRTASNQTGESPPGASLEASRRGNKAPSKTKTATAKTSEPFSEAFVTDVVGRAIWLSDNLGLQLIECWALLRAESARSARLGRTTSHPTSIEERRAIIANFPWHDAAGKPLLRLPWAMTWARQLTTTAAWPPRDASSINVMIGILQALNYCLVSFCTGGRSSEVLDGTDDSIDPTGAGRYQARTFKLNDSEEGAERDWPLHPRAEMALQLQKEIARVIRPEGKTHLWMLLQDGAEPAGSPLRNVNEPVVHAVSQLGLAHLTGNSRPHSHRWRHTIARLIAICVAAAPQVLMDLFGHRDLEMTLHYMLSDPRIAQDVKRVAAEIAYTIAEEALTDVEAGAASGPAAATLREGMAGFKSRRGEEALGAATMTEAISILTFNGRQWQAVREGVICTKGLGQFGPCTQGRGDADAGACRPECDHRLELARAKAHCEGALSSLLSEHGIAYQEGAEMVVAYTEGLILAQLMRWDDVRERVLANSETARAIWSKRNVKEAA